MPSALPKEDIYHLPDAAPGMIGGDVRQTDSLPWALYSIDSEVSESSLVHLATELEQDYVIDVPTGEDIHLVRAAPTSSLHQPSLQATLDTHVRYANENKQSLAYYPYGCLVVHNGEWGAEGLWLVHVDFEHGHPVTAFRLKAAEVAEVCETLRNDDDSASQMERDYKMNE